MTEINKSPRRLEARHYLGTPPIRIAVGQGDTQKDFYIHEGLICARSEFFKNALSGKWAESANQVVTLQDDDPETLFMYQQLIYTDDLQLEGITEKASVYVALSKTYVIADKLLDTSSKKIILKGILKLCRNKAYGTQELPSAESLTIIYEGTSDNDEIRSALAKVYAYEGVKTTMDSIFQADSPPMEFFYDLSRYLWDDFNRSRRGLFETNKKIDHTTANLEKVAVSLEDRELELVKTVSALHSTRAELVSKDSFIRKVEAKLGFWAHKYGFDTRANMELHSRDVEQWLDQIRSFSGFPKYQGGK
ncbi:hypothetical protein M011DRAFT_473106 [Sporormia fimetaria CBS 119925]|uniref:BTB domain-containing protein n=1 Tax=Sporormia fimetaria CBS 119925 TaxID=1340428 RepID=A0A6A6VRE4_9PLEO|nr:hypothetical protein M011DRAFT_473106 [Sporormia fimetaria CBS 119925]